MKQYLKSWVRITLVLNIVQLVSCYHNVEKDSIEEDSIENIFSVELIDHFPKEIANEKNVYQGFNLLECFMVCFDLLDNDIKSILNMHIDSGYAQYNANDSCLFVIQRELAESNSLKRKYNNKCESHLPIPDFSTLVTLDDDELGKLPKDFELFIIETSSGIFLKKDLLRPLRSMPSGWENGISRGVAVSIKRKAVIYWLSIW